ncbi:CRE-KQT-2 protein [Aphelenchoides avenae]|nr:CRE-KQT-2 protein [Aphelenchus avenae]
MRLHGSTLVFQDTRSSEMFEAPLDLGLSIARSATGIITEKSDSNNSLTVPLQKRSITAELPPTGRKSSGILRRSSGYLQKTAALMDPKLFQRRKTSPLATTTYNDTPDSTPTASTAPSLASIEFSDEEKILDYYYDNDKGDTSSVTGTQSVDCFSMTDTSTVGHYRQILRMIYFFIFLTWRKKFNRARKPYELVDAEAELVAMEDQRGKKFKQLELRIEATIGKAHSSQLNPDSDESSIQTRIELCEEKLHEMEQKAQMLEQLATLIMKQMISSAEAHPLHEDPVVPPPTPPPVPLTVPVHRSNSSRSPGPRKRLEEQPPRGMQVYLQRQHHL